MGNTQSFRIIHIDRLADGPLAPHVTRSSSTQRYVEADLAMKEKALTRLVPPDTTVRKFRVPDSLMGFLQTL